MDSKELAQNRVSPGVASSSHCLRVCCIANACGEPLANDMSSRIYESFDDEKGIESDCSLVNNRGVVEGSLTAK
ncbi:hypothetical protein HanXRQr2_Chr04g0191591 [Helianthus annuus]|uniref:Uncharacterized protein n=1 Tax=Helianthus annuus TaxID=4232 RepID=A0A9K3JDE3_HELAN|nr:hypothetical protein HanXRQr2_Chr04g0191591 [Helianthus annuus]KAJ0933467.1 hypothetical protein HanPSC8_Chr04g0185131 [Helianthus annuus]